MNRVLTPKFSEARTGPDVERFEELFQNYSRRLWGFFRQRGFNPEECKDLTQETFLQVYRGLSTFEGRSSFETWLFHVAANVYRKELRRRGARKRQGRDITWDGAAHRAAEAGEGEGGPRHELLDKERLEALKNAINELPAQMRRCMVLRVYQECSYADIAAVMKISIETVKVHLFRARQKLAGLLGGEVDGK
jgi:RNA polymerase sigma-70 factor (ECF subfamily)